MKDTRLRDQFVESFCDVMKLHNNVINEFEAKIEQYEKALKFYANEENYEEDKFNMHFNTPLVEYDRGERAREVLSR